MPGRLSVSYEAVQAWRPRLYAVVVVAALFTMTFAARVIDAWGAVWSTTAFSPAVNFALFTAVCSTVVGAAYIALDLRPATFAAFRALSHVYCEGTVAAIATLFWFAAALSMWTLPKAIDCSVWERAQLSGACHVYRAAIAFALVAFLAYLGITGLAIRRFVLERREYRNRVRRDMVYDRSQQFPPSSPRGAALGIDGSEGSVEANEMVQYGGDSGRVSASYHPSHPSSQPQPQPQQPQQPQQQPAQIHQQGTFSTIGSNLSETSDRQSAHAPHHNHNHRHLSRPGTAMTAANPDAATGAEPHAGIPMPPASPMVPYTVQPPPQSDYYGTAYSAR